MGARQRMLAGLALMACLGAGCGDDETSTESKTTSAPKAAPAETSAAAPETPTPAAGSTKLTTAQRQELLEKNNAAVLGEGGHAEVAKNYRAYAEPLAAGECKQALSDLASAEDAFAKALDAGKPLAERQRLGQQVLKGKSRVDSAC